MNKYRLSVFLMMLMIILNVFISNAIADVTAPVVTTNNYTGVQETNCTLRGNLSDDGGGQCYISFDLGTNLSYGTNINLTSDIDAETSKTDSGGWFDWNKCVDESWSTYGYVHAQTDDYDATGYETFTYTNPFIPLGGFNWTFKFRNDITAGGSAIFQVSAYNWSTSSYYQIYYNNSITYEAPGSPGPVTKSVRIPDECIGSQVKIKTYIYTLGTSGHYTTTRYWEGKLEYNINDARNFSYNKAGLSPGTFYFFRAKATNRNSTVNGSCVNFFTKPNTPTVLNVVANSSSQNYLTWTKGTGANYTYIERNTSSSWPFGSGIIVYNGTGNHYQDCNLVNDTTYYYHAWGYKNWNHNSVTYQHYSDGNISDSVTTSSLPVVTLSSPVNNSEQDISFSNLSVVITGTGYFNFSIETRPGCGFAYSNLSTTGTKYCNINLDYPLHGTKYKWFVNVSQDNNWVNRSYYFWGNITYVNPPANGSFSYNSNTHVLSLNWSKGQRAHSSLVVRNNNSFPASINDGNVLQNDTTHMFNITIVNYSYFTVFSYNSTAGIYNSTGLDIPWAFVGINVFNESETSQAIHFNIEVTNSDTSLIYTNTSCTNTHFISFQDIPYGENTIFIIKNASYKFRTYYKDIYLNHYYNFTFYLPPIETPVEPGSGDDGGNTSDTIICLISIIDQISKPIPNVKIDIKRYIANTNIYESVSTVFTDGNGQVSLWLVPDENYYFECQKTGYVQTGSKYWIPTSLLYTKTFMLELVETYEDNETSYDEEIIFNGCILGNNTLLVNYTDLMGLTINTTIYVFETNTTSNITSLIRTDNRNDSDSFQITIPDCNRNYTYRVVIHLNHSFFNYVIDYFIIEHRTTITNESNIENKFVNVFGPNLFGWVPVIDFFILLACMFSFGKRHVGVGLVITGGIMLFISAVIGIPILHTSISILFMVCGILVQWQVNRMEFGG